MANEEYSQVLTKDNEGFFRFIESKMKGNGITTEQLTSRLCDMEEWNNLLSGEYMDKLIKIQTNIHSKKCPYLPIQKQKLTDYINSAHLDRYLKLDLLDMLNSSPKHKKLCHGNLTPHNIIIKDDNIYVTDWNHASQGNASADVARTYLWMLINMPDYAENYLERFCNETNTSSKYVHNWIPIVAAARCAKNIPEEVKILNGLISVMEY